MKGGKAEVEGMAIFGEAKIDGLTIKPWTLKQVIQLTSILRMTIKNLQDRGVDFTDLNKDVTPEFLADLLEGIAPVLPEFISVTLRFDSIVEAEEMEWGKAIAIGTQIFVLNWNHIKNFLGQIQGGVETLKMAEEPVTTTLSPLQ